ncbi:MAG: PhoPQ-activated protein PqaA family protein [Fimbriimonadaceae bacterium]
MLLSLLPLAIFAAAPTALADYLNREDKTFEWKPLSDVSGSKAWEMTSQTWQGIPWRHTVTLTRPSVDHTPGGCILLITGGRPNPSDLGLARQLADRAGISVAILFDIPNQPIDGRREDDLIAHTFERYLATGDASWPLLFPMVKSALRAMDLLEEATTQEGRPIRRFVVTGASKRGWTTWFVGVSGDRRVAGIAPMVIDNLNLVAQMRHQHEIWSGYSPQIADYTRRGLQQLLDTPMGRKLAEIVDPFSYRSLLRSPVLIVNGANDAYWAVDALSLYWPELPKPKSAVLVPNAGHDLGDKLTAIATISAFARSCLLRRPWPQIDWKVGSGKMDVRIARVKPESCSVWVAESGDSRFVESEWKSSAGPLPGGSEPWSVSVPQPKAKRPFAWFVSFRFRDGAETYDLSTGAVLVRR